MKIKSTLFTSFFFLLSIALLAQTNTTANGNWSASSNWTAGVPTNSSTALVNHNMTLDQKLTLGSNANYSIKNNVIDQAGGSKYKINLST